MAETDHKDSDRFFKASTLGTTAGCVAAVVLIVNTIRSVTDWGPLWFAFVVSLIVSIVAFKIGGGSAGSSAGKRHHALVSAVLILLNGCIIYTSAYGTQHTIAKGVSKDNDESNTGGEAASPPASSSQPQGLHAEVEPDLKRLGWTSPW